MLDIAGKSVFEQTTEYEELPFAKTLKDRTLIKVQDGCNNFCSYCIVPYVRGRERSRQPIDIINEVKSLVKEGYKEITLLGQNVDSYGKDLNPKVDFSSLLKMVAEVEGKFRIRFVSNHPKDRKTLSTILSRS
jgi:tRNA-2-methylthio-N6-dimethylallyladenosine synthase